MNDNKRRNRFGNERTGAIGCTLFRAARSSSSCGRVSVPVRALAPPSSRAISPTVSSCCRLSCERYAARSCSAVQCSAAQCSIVRCAAEGAARCSSDGSRYATVIVSTLCRCGMPMPVAYTVELYDSRLQHDGLRRREAAQPTKLRPQAADRAHQGVRCACQDVRQLGTKNCTDESEPHRAGSQRYSESHRQFSKRIGAYRQG